LRRRGAGGCYASLWHFCRKLRLAAPASVLPSLPTALARQASRLHFFRKLDLAAPASGLPSLQCSGARRSGWAHLLWTQLPRALCTRSRVCRSHSARNKARRDSSRAADQVRPCHKHDHCQGAWPRRAADTARPRRRGDRVSHCNRARRFAAVHESGFGRATAHPDRGRFRAGIRGVHMAQRRRGFFMGECVEAARDRGMLCPINQGSAPRESGAADRTPPPLLLRKALQAEVGVLLGLIPRPVGGEPA
jgi:hypothetical protein